MAQDEFAIIERHFTDIGPATDRIVLGIGDDAAVTKVDADRQLVVTMDTLVSGVHFSNETDPADIAYKALAVNLSDLAAMGASPEWFLLSLTLTDNKPQWLSRFALGLKQAADDYRVRLVGGDTCCGDLSISIQIAGSVPDDKFVTRSCANPGDLIVVSGELGNAALGLAVSRGELVLPADLQVKSNQALNRPRPRLEMASFLQDFATAAIDISDGLVADLGHIVDASGCGANILQAALPVVDWIASQNAYHYALYAGDDYEICCCISPANQIEVDAWNRRHPDCRLSIIGEMHASGYRLQQGHDRYLELDDRRGYRHFD